MITLQAKSDDLQNTPHELLLGPHQKRVNYKGKREGEKHREMTTQKKKIKYVKNKKTLAMYIV